MILTPPGPRSRYRRQRRLGWAGPPAPLTRSLHDERQFRCTVALPADHNDAKMDEEIQFRFSIPKIPEGEALTCHEIEKELLKKLSARDGKCPDSLWSLAVLYQRAGHFDRATACLHGVAALTDDLEKLGACHLALGQIEESKQDFAAAAKYYRQALMMEPCSTGVWYFIHNNLGYSLNQLKQHGSAIPWLQRAIEIDPAKPNAYKNLGLSHAALGHLEQAAEFFIAATRVEAADDRSLHHLDALLEAHPALEVDHPDLRERVEACRMAVAAARGAQPDFADHWRRLREAQKPKWWQFWKGRRRID